MVDKAMDFVFGKGTNLVIDVLELFDNWQYDRKNRG